MTRAKKSTDDWMKIIQDCRTSGLSDSQWCEENGISPSTFYYNVNKLRKKACDIPSSQRPKPTKVFQEVVPVTIIDDAVTCDSAIAPESVAIRKTADMNKSADLLSLTSNELHKVPAATVDFHGMRISIMDTASADSIRHIFAAMAELC